MKERKEISRPGLKVAGAALVLGLVIEAATLYWSHPTAFLTFLGIGASLVGSGMLLYLWLVLSGSPAVGSVSDATEDP